jgi:hypothetical protein
MDKLNHYKTALYLSLVVALSNFVGWGLIVSQNPRLSTHTIMIFAVPFLIFFGLWVQSVIACSVGVLWMLFWAGTLVWQLLSSRPSLTTVFFVASAALNLLTAGVMLTRKFRTEFSYEREHQPKYKVYLKRFVFGAVVVAMLIATLNNISRLASS